MIHEWFNAGQVLIPVKTMIRNYQQWSPHLAGSVYVDPQATVVGRATIGADSSVWPQAVIRADIHRIDIGARSNIQDGAVLHVTHDSEYTPGGRPLLIHDDVTVGHNATLHGCTIESTCLIGMGSIVLDAAVLESGVMLGAGSLVTPGKRLEGGYLWMGAPARRVRKLTAEEQAYLPYAAAHYVREAAKYRMTGDLQNLDD